MDPWNTVHFDENGLIVQRDGDGGDTAQRSGWAWFGRWYHQEVLGRTPPFDMPITFEATMDFLEDRRTGEFRRHPGQDPFDQPDRFSRDQLIPVVAALGVHGDQTRLNRSRDAWRPCHLIATCVQGTRDVAGPELINHYHRALSETPDPLGDAVLLGGVAIRLEQAHTKPEDVGDDLNLLIYLALAKLRSPSTNTDAALAAYLRLRPVSCGCFLTRYRETYPDDLDADETEMTRRIRRGRDAGWTPDCHPALGALRWYFRPETKGSPGLAELYKPIVDDLDEKALSIPTASISAAHWR